jgi:hypothetical protein
MRKTVLTILGALLIAGSAVQMATASEHHVRKAYRASIAASQQFRNAYKATAALAVAISAASTRRSQRWRV